MGAQKQDALIPNVPLRYAFENTSAENLLPASPRPQGALAEAELPGKGREFQFFQFWRSRSSAWDSRRET